MRKKINACSLFLFFILVHVCTVHATQFTDTVITLPPFVVKSNRLTNFSAGHKILTIDSAEISNHLSLSLGELLRNETPVFIKSYGVGALSTSAFRGGSAVHTAVLWNGFNINSATTGQVDFSLLPLFAINNVTVQYGGGSALWGSGAVGGSIHLQNAISLNRGFVANVSATAGSFGRFAEQFSVLLSKKKWATSFSIYNTGAKNNFSFRNPYSNEIQIQQHADFLSTGIINDNVLQIHHNQQLNFSVWYQISNRNIPPVINQIQSLAKQNDASLRISSEWKYFRNKFNYYLRTAYFNEQLEYFDEMYLVESGNNSNTLIGEAETKIHLKQNQTLNLGVNNTFVNVNSSGFIEEHSQNRTSFFASYGLGIFKNRLQITTSLRKEIISSQVIPFTYSAGANYKVFNQLMLKANFSKVYRLPTFNDLYWQPGGNISLLPEDGYSQEIGFNFIINTRNEKIKFQSEQTYFSRNIYNWIIWLPSGRYWSPQNLMQVWSRGVETKSSFSVLFYKTTYSISLLTNYVVSTNQKLKSESDASFDKQLIYTPMYSGHVKLSVTNKLYSLSVTSQYTGYRYTSTDNTEFLPPFYIANCRLSYNLYIKKITYSIFFSVDNIFNSAYMLVQNHAMPLRNFNIGLVLKLNKPNKN